MRRPTTTQTDPPRPWTRADDDALERETLRILSRRAEMIERAGCDERDGDRDYAEPEEETP